MPIGIVAGLLLNNSILLIFTREKSYLYYCLYILSFGIFLALYDGIAYQYWPAIAPVSWEAKKSIWRFSFFLPSPRYSFRE